VLKRKVEEISANVRSAYNQLEQEGAVI